MSVPRWPGPVVPARTWLVLSLLLPMSLAGCLGDDIWREPFDWNEAADLGENQDAAQAFAAGLVSLVDQGAGQGEAVLHDVRDLPDSVVFHGYAAGSGDQVDDAVHVVVHNATDAGLTLTGQVADAYAQATGPLTGTADPITFEVADRATRVRWTLDVALTGQEAPEPGQNPTPVGAVAVRIFDPQGALRAEYDVDTTRQILDEVVEGTFGGRNEVRAHLGGTWRVEVDANAEGAWSLVVEAYEPRYDDYRWWQFWRAESRTGGT